MLILALDCILASFLPSPCRFDPESFARSFLQLPGQHHGAGPAHLWHRVSCTRKGVRASPKFPGLGRVAAGDLLEFFEE